MSPNSFWNLCDKFWNSLKVLGFVYPLINNDENLKGLFNAQELDKKARKYLFDIVLTNIHRLRWGDIEDFFGPLDLTCCIISSNLVLQFFYLVFMFSISFHPIRFFVRHPYSRTRVGLRSLNESTKSWCEYLCQNKNSQGYE